MLKKLLNKIIIHIKENFAHYGISTAALLSGAFVAVVCAFSLSELGVKELALYFEDFFNGFLKSGADAKLIMISVIKTNAITFCLLILFSAMIIGAPFIVFVGVCRGFAFGFAVSFIFKLYGARALLIILSAILPHIIFAFSCIVMALALCLRFCLLLKNDRIGIKKRIPAFLLNLTGIFMLVFAIALMQAYIEPVLIELIAGYFV